MMLTCPRCNAPTARGGIPAWQILVAVCFFPVGLLALLGGRKPTRCPNCQYTWQA